MRKFVSVALAAIMVVSSSAIAVPAMAAYSPGPEITTTTTQQPVHVTVNSSTSSKVNYSKKDNQFTFTYTGNGNVKGWKFEGLTEGKDYKIVSKSEDGKKIVIELTEAGKEKTINADAIVTFDKDDKGGVQVNGKDTTSKTVSKTVNKNKDTVTYTYKGNKTVTGWKFPGLKKDVDYKIVKTTKNSITIKLINGTKSSNVTANAIVKAKKDSGSKSPATGASMAGIAVAGAGVAMLAALKKKD